MQFRYEGMLGGIVVVALVLSSFAFAPVSFFHAGCCPPEHQQRMHLSNWCHEIKLHVLRHNLHEWNNLAAVLCDFHIASSDQRLPERDRERYRELVSYGSEDLWGSEIMILPGAKSPNFILRSYGPNGRDDGGGGDDIEVEINFR